MIRFLLLLALSGCATPEQVADGAMTLAQVAVLVLRLVP